MDDDGVPLDLGVKLGVGGLAQQALGLLQTGPQADAQAEQPVPGGLPPALFISSRFRSLIVLSFISGWKTGVLAYGNTWVSAQDCRFENNTTGFHFNAVSGTVTYYTYTGNEFVNNGTAVLLESVPGDSTLLFDNCLFSGNDTDIDNRCGQSVDISKAIFE